MNTIKENVLFEDYALIIDAVFGTGFNKELKSNELLLVFLEDVSIYGTETVSTLLRIVLKRDSVEIEDLSNEYDKVNTYIKKISDSVNLESWPPKDFATLESKKLFSINL